MKNPQVLLNLQEGEIMKLFPKSFYEKYAKYLKIDQYEQQTLKKTVKTSKLDIDLTSLASQHKLTINVGQKQPINCKKENNKLYEDELRKNITENKIQMKRMAKYVQNLNHRLNKPPPKNQAIIRTVITNEDDIDNSLLAKLAALDDQNYQNRSKQLLKMKNKQHYTKFTSHSIQLHKSQSLLSKTINKHNSTFQTVKSTNLITKSGLKDKQIVRKIQQLSKNCKIKNQNLNYESNKKDIISYVINQNNAIKEHYKILKGVSIQQEDRIMSILRRKSNNIIKQKQPTRSLNLYQQTAKVRKKAKSLFAINLQAEQLRTKKIQNILNQF